MITLVSDENFDGDIVRGLLRRLPELDLVRVQDADLIEAPDPLILAWAAAENRVLLTHDRDTMPVLRAQIAPRWVSFTRSVPYLHNRTQRPGHFIRFSLEGTRSNRDAVGARVTLRWGGRRHMAERIGGGSYQSAGDPRLHFGLGASRQVEAVEVRWPSGQVDHHEGLAADREYRLREAAQPMEVKDSRRELPGPDG